ncbi:hypothetical protein B7P43_G10302 [Cryptotermes secundus]|uniref:Uncharacterized protein n=1 Tax=Cryptotermes secundus TaxID=105785 RepID=A0A2J7PJE5_9NEOP|nr:hypothetical protein B7P43_G10302 [Cryptotermes secundus]
MVVYVCFRMRADPLELLMCQNCVREFEALTPVTMRSTVFWDATLSSPIEVHRCFRGMYCLHLQVQKISQASRLSCS